MTASASADASPEAASLAEALDLTLTAREPAPCDRALVHSPDPSAALAEIAAAVTARPQASLVLAALLRTTETSPCATAWTWSRWRTPPCSAARSSEDGSPHAGHGDSPRPHPIPYWSPATVTSFR